MNRRHFLAAALAAPLIGRLVPETLNAQNTVPSPAACASLNGWRRFEITTRVILPDTAGPTRLWLPLAQTAGDYQISTDVRWDGTGQTERMRDIRYGAPILRATWDEQDPAPRRLDVVQTVSTRDRAASPFSPLTEAERQFWTSPTDSLPVDGIVRETAMRITKGETAPRDQLHAIYDWVVDNTWRDPATPGCGRGNIEAMLRSGQLAGKCADINGLLVGLARASGFPARDTYGIRVAASRLSPSLGSSGNITKAQHCRAEVFLDEEGWFPLDAADVCKVALEQKLGRDSIEVKTMRDRLFGSWEMNWIGYNSGTDIQLPGFGPGKSDVAFLMYPHAVSASETRPFLDPARFHYEIISRELTV